MFKQTPRISIVVKQSCGHFKSMDGPWRTRFFFRTFRQLLMQNHETLVTDKANRTVSHERHVRVGAPLSRCSFRKKCSDFLLSIIIIIASFEFLLHKYIYPHLSFRHFLLSFRPPRFIALFLALCHLPSSIAICNVDCAEVKLPFGISHWKIVNCNVPTYLSRARQQLEEVKRNFHFVVPFDGIYQQDFFYVVGWGLKFIPSKLWTSFLLLDRISSYISVI